MNYSEWNAMYVERFKDHLENERRVADRTVKNYLYFLSRYLKFLTKDPILTAKDDISDFLKYLYGRDISNGAVANFISSLRAFYSWMSFTYKHQNLSEVSYYLNKIVRVKFNNNVAKCPSPDQMDRLYQTITAYKQAYSFNKGIPDYSMVLRDHAVIELLRSAGMRSMEVRRIQVEDIDFVNLNVLIRTGKGEKQRISIFSEKAGNALSEYLGVSAFMPGDRIFNFTTGQLLNYLIRKWAKRAGIDTSIHAHSFRHFHITDALRNEVPIELVADQVGHNDIGTTRKYMHLDEIHRRKSYLKHGAIK